MEGLLQPVHLIFILLIVLILFGAGKLPNIGEGLGRIESDLRGEFSEFRNALFMAKGADPAVGRDLGDMLPNEEARRNRVWLKLLVAILVGNTLYFISMPLMPAAARFNWERVSALPPLVDFWLCAFMFGVLNLASVAGRRLPPKASGRK